MKTKQNKKSHILLAAIFAVMLFVGQGYIFSDHAYAKTCGGVEVAYFECGDEFTGNGGVETSGLWGILTVVLNIMIAGVGILAVGGIVYGAIMYASAQDNASQVQEAIGIIRNTIIGLVLFAFMYALLQFLIPGGIL